MEDDSSDGRDDDGGRWLRRRTSRRTEVDVEQVSSILTGSSPFLSPSPPDPFGFRRFNHDRPNERASERAS